jgi:hypothetical protein
MKRLLLIALLLQSACLAHAQFIDTVTFEQEYETSESADNEQPDMQARPPSVLSATREYKSEDIEIRKFDEEKWRKIVNARDYTDERTRKNKPRSENPAQGDAGKESGPRVRTGEDGGDPEQYDYDREGNSSVDLSWLGPIGSIIFYMAIAAVIILILLQIVRNTSFKANPKKPLTPSDNAEEIHDISQLDTESLIQKAHKAGYYKLAIRLYFLDLLKTLNENGVILWTKDKTNHDYLSEIFSKQYYFDEVRHLTLAYERVWYGEHVPTEERYHALIDEFREIHQKFSVS